MIDAERNGIRKPVVILKIGGGLKRGEINADLRDYIESKAR